MRRAARGGGKPGHISAFPGYACETTATGRRQPNHIHSDGFFFFFFSYKYFAASVDGVAVHLEKGMHKAQLMQTHNPIKHMLGKITFLSDISVTKETKTVIICAHVLCT